MIDYHFLKTAKVIVIPEKVIRKAAADSWLDKENNSFIYALEKGGIFKENKLTPLYFLHKETKVVYVTSKQHIKKMFH